MKAENFLDKEKDHAVEYLSAYVAYESALPGNSGKILLSTLWNQYGTIYVKSGSGQTALNGYTYDQYCPLNSAYSSEHSVTGCTNTADAQVLYYWLEKGATLTLQVSADDYFELKSNSTTYYL